MIPPDASFLGLPIHPLVVHLVVVALPVGALATVASVVSPWFRARYTTLSVGVLTVGALAAVAAVLSGNQLALTEGLPEQHQRFGTATMAVSVLTAALAWLWRWLERRRELAAPGTASFAAMLTGGLTAAACLAVAVLTALTGHSGATATWGEASPAPPADAAPEATPDAARLYTMADIAVHDSAESCWAALDGGVYDLTTWIDAHPGGRERILQLCGTDATERFSVQHGDAGRPNSQLARLRIGHLG